MEELILSIGRAPRQRTTLYGIPNTQRVAASFNASPLTPPIESNMGRRRSSTVAAVQH
jgi:FO synthase